LGVGTRRRERTKADERAEGVGENERNVADAHHLHPTLVLQAASSLSRSRARKLGDFLNQLRLDPLSGRWIAVTNERRDPDAIFAPRPLYTEDQRDDCPFCPGNEGQTPPALETYGSDGKWVARVVPNLHPAFEGSRPFVVDHKGPVFSEAPASGIHEVVVFSPEHHLVELQ
jgi:hypothetical protein